MFEFPCCHTLLTLPGPTHSPATISAGHRHTEYKQKWRGSNRNPYRSPVWVTRRERSPLSNIQPPSEEGARNWKHAREHTLHQIHCIRVHSPLRPKHCSLRWENWGYNPAFSRIWAPWGQEFPSAGICSLSKWGFAPSKTDTHFLLPSTVRMGLQG